MKDRKQVQPFSLNAKVQGGTRVIAVDYDEDALVFDLKNNQLSGEVVKVYQNIQGEAPVDPNCIIELRATAVNSAVIYALYELHKQCKRGGGRLYVVGYPKDYIQSLSSLGLADAPTFRLSASTAAALQEIVDESGTPQ